MKNRLAAFILSFVLIFQLIPLHTLADQRSSTVPIVLGDFSVAGVGTNRLVSDTALLSQKTLIAVPYPGAELTLTVKDGYQVRVHSGNNANRIDQVSAWLGAEDDGTDSYTYSLPTASIYMRISLRRSDGAAMTQTDLSLSGLTVTYESTSDIVEDNAHTAQILSDTDLPVLLHISDIHGDTIRAGRAAQFAAEVGADALLASGDLTAYDPDDWGSALFDTMAQYSDVNFIYGIGNHDTKISASIYQETVYNSYFSHNPATADGETYYYQDLPGQKLRLISVNQQEGASTTTRGGTCYSQAQVDWLVETLKSTPAGYGVVLMYHSPETAIADAKDPEYSEFFQTGNRFDTSTNSYSGYTGTFLMDLIDAFMLRKNFTWSYSEKNGTSPVTLNADFTAVAEGVEFIAHLTGHVHSDSITYLPGAACKQLLLGVTCTTSMYGEEGGYYGLADYSDLIRQADTANQDAFNAYVIDRENKTVRVLRIGAQQTVSGAIRDDMTIPYSIPFTPTPCPFDTEGLIELDLYDVAWVNYGIQANGADPTYYPGLRWSTDYIFDVPYDGVTLYVKINAPFELGIRSGVTETAMNTNHYWLNNKSLSSGEKDQGYIYTLPAGHKKFILSVANVARPSANAAPLSQNEMNSLEFDLANVEIWYAPPCTHAYTTTVTAPTCISQGYTTYSCSKCSYTHTDDPIPAPGHSYADGQCTVCGAPESPEYPFDTSGMVQLDLRSVEWVNYGFQPDGTDPTYYTGQRMSTNCIFDVPYDGVTLYIRINSPYELGIRSGATDAAMSTNHYWLNNKALSSGTKNAGYSYTIPTGHTKFILSIANVSRNASGDVKTASNPITFLDLAASDIEIWYTPLHTHTYKSTYTEPTCTAPGYTTHICTTCGDTYTDGYEPAPGHDYSEWYAADEDTRQCDCSRCGHAKIFTRLAMPLYYSGEVYIETNPNGLYCGSRNLADLLGLKDGTYTANGVTITVEGTAISVTGTPTKTLYFDLQAGTFGTPDYKRDPGYSLPDGDYRFGLTGSGTVFPTACIRNPNGVGNLMATTGVTNAPALSGADFGIPYLYLPVGKSYDFFGKLMLNLNADRTFDGDSARTETIEGTGEFEVSGYLSSPGQAAVFGELASRDTALLIYSNGSKEYLNIYLPQQTGYLQIQMNLEDNTSTNAYGWRLNMMYACDDGLNQKFPVTSSGEYEAAIQLEGRPDFMGMGAHGSERMTSFAIYIDGTEVTLDQLAVLADWNTLRIVRESELYDPLDETTVVATHTVIYDYDLTGLTVTQDVDWLVDSTCMISYMMMFPVRRAYEGHQITDTYFDDFSATEYDVSQEGFTTYPLQWTTGATKMTLHSEKSGVTASMERLETSALTGTGYKHCANSAAYNKLYFTVCGGGGSTHTVTTGDQWHTKHRYEVILTQGTDISLSCVYGHTPGHPVVENEGPHGSHDAVTYCSICGEELSREHDDGYLPGDINGDGLVNNKDVTRLFQYLSNYEVEVVTEALDVNGDGLVNNKDVTRLFQYLSNYDVEIH